MSATHIRLLTLPEAVEDCPVSQSSPAALLKAARRIALASAQGCGGTSCAPSCMAIPRKSSRCQVLTITPSLR
jgi:hypothetical protein